LEYEIKDQPHGPPETTAAPAHRPDHSPEPRKPDCAINIPEQECG